METFQPTDFWGPPSEIRITEAPLTDSYITLPGLPSSAEVQEYAEERPHLTPKPQTSPLWTLVCLWTGTALLVAFAGLAVVVAYLVLVQGWWA